MRELFQVMGIIIAACALLLLLFGAIFMILPPIHWVLQLLGEHVIAPWFHYWGV